MDASLWIAKTGLTAQQTRMQVISNNLANVNTTGFKKDRAVFEDLLYQNIVPAGGQTDAQSQTPTGLMLGTGTRVLATEKLHGQGNISTAVVEDADEITTHTVESENLFRSPAGDENVPTAHLRHPTWAGQATVVRLLDELSQLFPGSKIPGEDRAGR